MAKVSEITYDIREAVRQYIDDSELDDRYILYLVAIKRAKYLRQQLNNFRRTTDNSALQTFCVEMVKVNASECDVEYECNTIVRSKKPIPTPIDLHTKPAITSVKSTSVLGVPFNFVEKNRAVYASSHPSFTGMITFYDSDGYLYATSSKKINFIDCLTITGVFEDPLELKNYSNCCSCDDAESCFDENTTDYPLQSHLLDLVREEVVRDILRTEQIPEDRENDTIDE